MRGIWVAALATALIVTLFPNSSAKSSSSIDQVLRESVAEKKIPGVVAMVYMADHVTYQGASGKRDTIKNIPITADSIFRIASMTKPITSVAVMQLVESGRVKLDEGAAARDYLNFERMLLGGGRLDSKRVLQSETVAQMTRNQIGDLTLPEMRSLIPQLAKNPIRVPGLLDKFGLGLAINTKPVERGRSAGSLAWGGIYNTFFWIDPSRKTCAVTMMQILPFSDDAANSVVELFERAVHANASATVAPGRHGN